MQMIPLATTGRVTSRLGFGGSSLMGALNRRQSLALLETAYDSGIRHFDTAPCYGFGESEACLGEFLTRHRHDCTVTTKFGIPYSRNKTAIRFARAIVGPFVQRSSGFKKRLQSAMLVARGATPAASARPNPTFTADRARASIEASLSQLKVDCIDLLLLHEVKALDLASDSASDALLELLESLVTTGTIGAFGIGSDREEVGELLARHPRYCSVVQYEWNVFNDAVLGTNAFRIHHRSLSGSFRKFCGMLKSEPECLKRLSDRVGEDLADSEMLANLMLKASLVKNSDSIILFSSKSHQHIKNNVAVADNAKLEPPARRLCELLPTEDVSAPLELDSKGY